MFDFHVFICVHVKGVLNLSKIKKRTYGFTDGVLTAVLGTGFKKLPHGFGASIKTQNFSTFL